MISLEKDIERWNQSKNLLNEMEIEPIKFSAIYAKDINLGK